MKVHEEEARASSLLATLSLAGPPDRRARAVSGAKAKVGRCARFIAQNAIQTHGAIGTTGELALGAYAKRLMAYEMQFGSTREHLRRYAATIGRSGDRPARLAARSGAGGDLSEGISMDLHLTSDDIAFRDDVRRFLADNVSATCAAPRR